ncbi:hypothetical protein CKF54_05000 [Psittacicella hinzii]|uniref:ABC transmembrane type-1 domain-containing protein n=1 Tax=Psittacicella hinzii TaxID=2028575 RepID=A0A3A1Y590_9GAMM|nr:ABC transporter permease subunit [Psittacicella hinzii]RIY32378.1 hypothetical protein CKF54_05000 [Psittacicella hinzii]
MKQYKWQEISIAWVVLGIIALFYLVSLLSLFYVRPEYDFNSSIIASWADLLAIVKQVSLLYLKNTLWQASLSATIILLLSYILAKAIYHLKPGLTSWLLTITNASFSLPTILVVFAFIGIFGQDGWLRQILPYQFSIYGLVGIVMANSYFNLGYCASAIYNGMQKIPIENIKQAQLCHFNLWQQWRYLELPYLKNNLINLWLLVFMLCFNSFALVLFLGGPRYSNFEIAIYNSLMIEGNFTKACVIAVLQILFSLFFIVIISLVKPKASNNSRANSLQELQNEQAYLVTLWPWAKIKRASAYLYSSLAILFISIPLLSLFSSGVKSAIFLYQNYQKQQAQANNLLEVESNLSPARSDLANLSTTVQTRELTGDTFSYPWSELFDALEMSLIIAGAATIVCLLASILILRGTRWLGSYAYQWINNLSLLSIIVPSMLLGAGYFLFFNVGLDVIVGTWGFVSLIILANAFTSIVFCLNYLYPAYQQIHNYTNLAFNIGMSSWQSFYLYELPLLKRSIIYAAITIFILSLGDYSIILFFVNNGQISSITYLLSHQLNSFASNQGNITAVCLLLLILSLRFIAYYFANKSPSYTKN